MWDLGAPTPVIQDEVARALADGGRLALAGGATVLVPGCGAAHDVRALAELPGVRRVVGADIVEQAAAAARAIVGGSAKAEVLCADFFAADDGRLEAGAFDLIVDYTFFCAIAPAQRAAWGARMAALLRPGGKLLTIVYPVAADALAADPAAPGPPHPVSVAELARALGPHGIVAEGEPRASALSVPQRAANEVIVWWSKSSAEKP